MGWSRRGGREGCIVFGMGEFCPVVLGTGVLGAVFFGFHDYGAGQSRSPQVQNSIGSLPPAGCSSPPSIKTE